MKTNLILINNDIVDAEEINVHPFNRGHQFGDGVYEIVPVYNGKALHAEAHMENLFNAIVQIRIPGFYMVDEMVEFTNRLIEAAEVTDGLLYTQVTRGIGPYELDFPGQCEPELIMQAVTNQGEASRTAIQTLSTMLGQDFNLVNSAVGNVQAALSNLALQQAVSVPQIINSIQSGDANIISAFQKCCCDNQLAMCQQTNALQSSLNNGFNGVQNSMAGISRQVEAKAAADQLAVCQQTYTLTDSANRNTQAVLAKLDAIEDARKDREIDALQTENTTLKSQGFIAGMMAQNLAPVNAALASLAKEVDDIKCKQPQTVSVQWPNLTAVNTTPYVSGGYYMGYGNGFGNNITF